MRPKSSANEEKQGDMFRVELEGLINPTHPLVGLAKQIAWEEFDRILSPYYSEGVGRPAIATRIMVGLHYLKYTYDLSDEEVVMRWVENPYWQYFCGSKWFEHEFPIDPSSMTRWRQKVGEAGVEKMLSETISVGQKTKIVKQKSFEKVNVDTTVQEKAIAFPTDAKLYYRMREKLVREAKRHGIELRQSYVRKAREALVKVGRYGHARQFKRMKRSTRQLRTYLGRVMRDIERKIRHERELQELFSDELALAKRVFEQKKESKKKVYSVHAPEVECISKGKAHKRYEFGNKVALVTTSREGFILGAKAFHGNPYDGHTLQESLDQAERVSGRRVEGDVFVDRGYRKHDYEGPARVHMTGRSTKTMSWSLRRWLRRHAAIEALIGHIKNDGRMNRNHLLGELGDQLNAILSACGQNMRLLLRADLPHIYFLLLFCRSISRSVHSLGTNRRALDTPVYVF